MEKITTPTKMVALEKIVCEAANITRADLYGRCRLRELSDARQVVWTVAHEHLGYSIMFIARLYSMQYSSVKHGIKRMEQLPEYKRAVAAIRKQNTTLLDAELSDGTSVATWDFKARK